MKTRPPQTCEIIEVYGLQLENGHQLKPGDRLQWLGEITIRASDEMDDLYTLHGHGSFIKLERGFFDMKGQPDRPYSVSDLARCKPIA